MNKISITLSIAFIVICINNVLGVFYPPSSILFTPLTLSILALIVLIIRCELKSVWVSSLLAGLIGLNDIGIKLFAGGRHDWQGQGWIHITLITGLIPAYIILIAGLFSLNYSDSNVNKWIAIILFPILMAWHILCFMELGIE